MSTIWEDKAFLISKIEDAFNDMANDTEIGPELYVLKYRRENETFEKLSSFLNKAFFSVNSEVFNWIATTGGLVQSFTGYMQESFKRAEKFNQGTFVYFDSRNPVNEYILKAKYQSDLDILVESSGLMIARIIGHFVQVKDRSDKKSYRTNRFFHLSRFNMPNLVLTHKHEFKEAEISSNIFKEGEVIWDIRTSIQKQVIATTVNDGIYSLLVKNPQDTDKWFETRVASDFRKNIKEIQSLDNDGKLLRIGDKIIFDNDKKSLDECMKCAGWSLIGDHNAYHYWRDLLGKWISEIKEFQVDGCCAIVQFLPTPLVKRLGMQNFKLKVLTRDITKLDTLVLEPMMRVIETSEPKDLLTECIAWEDRILENIKNRANLKPFVSEAKENNGNRSHQDFIAQRRMTQFDYEKTERENKEKADKLRKLREDEDDLKHGPYNLDKFKDKIFEIKGWAEYEGTRFICYMVDNKYGRIHTKSREGINSRKEVSLYFRAGRGDSKFMNIISDIVFSDEGLEIE